MPLGGEIFRTCPDRLPCNGYRVFPGGKEWPGRETDHSPPSSAVGHERVELYLYSPCDPYGLYRTSVPVQGCTLSIYLIIINVHRSSCKVNMSVITVRFLIKLELSRQIFEKTLKCQISRKSVLWGPSCSTRMDRQTQQSYQSLFAILRTRLKTQELCKKMISRQSIMSIRWFSRKEVCSHHLLLASNFSVYTNLPQNPPKPRRLFFMGTLKWMMIHPCGSNSNSF